jgi:hypothetical protein
MYRVRSSRGYGPETSVTVLSRDRGDRLTRLRAPTEVPHALASNHTNGPQDPVQRRLLTCMPGDHRAVPAVRPSSPNRCSGDRARSEAGPPRPRGALTHAGRQPPSPPPRLSSAPLSRRAHGLRPGGPRHGSRSLGHASPLGPGPHAPRGVSVCAATAWGLHHAIASTAAIPDHRPRAWPPPTLWGRQIVQDRGRPVPVGPALPSAGPMASVAFCSAAKPCPPPACRTPRRCSSAGSRTAACPRASAPTTACRAPRTRGPAGHRSRHGGCGEASAQQAATRVNRSPTAGRRGGSGRAKPNPRDRPRTLAVPNRIRWTASARHCTSNARLKRSPCHPRPPAMPPHRGRGPGNGRHVRTPTVAKCATAGPTGAFGGSARG